MQIINIKYYNINKYLWFCSIWFGYANANRNPNRTDWFIQKSIQTNPKNNGLV